MLMQTSRQGILFIACREAIVEVPYQDGKYLSLGCGHNGPDVKPGDRCTPQQALAQLKADLVVRERDVNRVLRVMLWQPTFDALVSLHYNRGNRDFPEMMALVNAGNMAGASAMFPTLDTNLAGQHLAGLRTRRLAEQKMFDNGDYGLLATIPWWKGDPHTTPRFEYVVQPGDLA